MPNHIVVSRDGLNPGSVNSPKGTATGGVTPTFTPEGSVHHGTANPAAAGKASPPAGNGPPQDDPPGFVEDTDWVEMNGGCGGGELSLVSWNGMCGDEQWAAVGGRW